jgi:hypothetical protein
LLNTTSEILKDTERERESTEPLAKSQVSVPHADHSVITCISLTEWEGGSPFARWLNDGSAMHLVVDSRRCELARPMFNLPP